MISIQVLFDKENNLIFLKGKGHAEYADYGTDIVCAAFTTALILSKNLLERFDELKNVHSIVEEGKFEFDVKNITKNNQVVLQNLYDSLLDLSMQYPKNIKIMN